ncbi:MULTISPECIES: sulfur carrier protein ThiS [unclassified Iodobacter]|uniref:sulfur carrier protein ThiS n=1 Tax=unclassified Iodobacter TaxID=235634 RepID=UPI0025DE86A3|nr:MULTISPECIES: sulfur carrier protein ThiS [unclassified Iodobacter]MDW5418562.1 sulfur carrier protein ThiS [Iodobacter sp. CM08]
MQISINGEAREFTAPLTLLDLIALLELKGKRIAIEQNGEIVPKSQHATTYLSEGDVLEMVVAVGGG